MLHSLNTNEKTKLSSKEVHVKQTDIYKSSLSPTAKTDELVPNDETEDKELDTKELNSWKAFVTDNLSSDDDSDNSISIDEESDSSVTISQIESEDDLESDILPIDANASILDMPVNELQTLLDKGLHRVSDV